MTNNKIYPVQNLLLKNYISHYFLLDFDDLQHENIEVKVPPLGFPVLQFHFGTNANYYQHKHFSNQSIFIGQCTRHVILYPAKAMKIIGVNFKPYGLYNLFGISPFSIQNSGLESSIIFGNDKIEFITEVLKAEGVERGILEIEKLLIAHQSKTIKQQRYFDQIVDKMIEENGLINYIDILDKNITARTFQRYFKEVIGISPKLFCQILRHKYILSLLYLNPDLKWSDLLLNGYYFDFAHFTKDFTLFSALTPQKYLRVKNKLASFLLEI